MLKQKGIEDMGIYNDSIRMAIMIIPAYALNLITVFLIQDYFKFNSILFLSPVIIGDIIAYAVNIQVFRKFGYPKK